VTEGNKLTVFHEVRSSKFRVNATLLIKLRAPKNFQRNTMSVLGGPIPVHD